MSVRNAESRRLGPRFEDALAFAHHLHGAQIRKDGLTPYIAHLMAVCALVLENGGTEDQAIAALLHDSLEDQGDGYPGGRAALSQTIRDRFGEAVLEIVDACSDDNFAGAQFLPHIKQRSWHRRKREFLASLDHATPAALLVIAADKLHNATRLLLDYRQSGEAVWKRFHVSDPEAQLGYYTRLAESLSRVFPGELSQRLGETVESLVAARAVASGNTSTPSPL